MKMIKDVTFDDFYMMIRNTYKSNNRLSTVNAKFEDGQEPVNLAFESQPGFKQYQRDRKGKISLNGELRGSEVTIGILYELMRSSYMSNNYVHSVIAKFDDGTCPLQLSFKTPEGFEQDQTQRKGTIEVLLD